jgi:hypothetical protein
MPAKRKFQLPMSDLSSISKVCTCMCKGHMPAKECSMSDGGIQASSANHAHACAAWNWNCIAAAQYIVRRSYKDDRGAGTAPLASAAELTCSTAAPRSVALYGKWRSRSTFIAAVVLGDRGSAERSSEDRGDRSRVLRGDSNSEGGSPSSLEGPPGWGRGSSRAS